MLSKNDILVDEDAFEEIMKNALTDNEETDVRGRIRRARHFNYQLMLP